MFGSVKSNVKKNEILKIRASELILNLIGCSTEEAASTTQADCFTETELY